MYTVSFPTPENLLDHFSDAFDDTALAVSSLVNEDGADQKIIAYFEEEPDRAEVIVRVALLAKTAGIEPPPISIKKVPPTDWLAYVYRGLHPLQLGRFYLYGSHEKNPNPEGRIPLLVNAATAFGSGHHPTTAVCLIALSEYAETHTPQTMLDLGCGAGTLAMAMAKLFGRKVLAVDIDPEAVRVTRVNVKLNRCNNLISTATGDVSINEIQSSGPYDLIMANILTQPLINMAPELSAQLAPGGTIILSGLLTSQEQYVIAAYVAQGLKLEKTIQREEWSALVLKK